MANEFTPGLAIRVGYNSVIDVTGSGRPLTPSETLDRYNVVDDDQILGIKNNIRNNGSFGLPAFDRRIEPDALKDLNNGWSLRDLGDVIFDESEPTGAAPISDSARIAFSAAAAESPATVSRGLARWGQKNPIAAVIISASVGVAMGLLIGTNRR